MIVKARPESFYFLVLGTISVWFSKIVVDFYLELDSFPQKLGGRAVGPLQIIHATATPGADKEPFAALQIMIEDIADDWNLYALSETERPKTLLKLYNDSTVQKIMKDCNMYHVEVKCSSSVYRTADGTCNNLKHPIWGSANTEKDSLLPPVYEGARGFRKSIRGKELPNPRSISLKLKQLQVPSTRVTSFFTFFGQFIAHDTTLVPTSTVNGSIPTCCDPSMRNHPTCHPIILPKDDPFYSKLNITCSEFIRSTPYPQCDFNKRKIVNMVTSFIDGSMIYDNSEKGSQLLRTRDESGKLIIQNSIFGQLLPTNYEKESFCLIKKPDVCFMGGDHRTNQNTMLTIFQTVFVEYHNYVAAQLWTLNPSWNGNKIYHEAKRIVGAVLQYIVYKEYLPLLIGKNNIIKYNLDTTNDSHYDGTVKPGTMIECSGAAFRLHSMIPTKISKYNDLEMKSSFAQTLPLFHGESASLLSGSAELPSETFDQFLVDDIKNFLFVPPGANYGLDLAALNIFRGRDFGLAPYIEIVKVCSEEVINIQNFNDLTQLMYEENVELLKNIYEDVEDIDLWVGLLMEKRLRDAEVGNTTACILSKQFHRLKFGDTFYFTHVNGRNPFINDQLKSIKSVSVAQIICLTTNLPSIRKYPLEMPNENNPIMPCSEFTQMDFQPWKE